MTYGEGGGVHLSCSVPADMIELGDGESDLIPNSFFDLAALVQKLKGFVVCMPR